MANTITGTDPGTYVAAVPVPVPGAVVHAADVQNAAQALANQTKHQDVVATALGVRTDVLRGSLGNRWVQFSGTDGPNAAAWDFVTNPGEWTLIVPGSGTDGIVAQIVLPKGSKVTQIRAIVKASGHGSNLPNKLPGFSFTKAGSGGGSTIATASDAGPVAAYDGVGGHQIVMTLAGAGEVIDDLSYSYTVRLTGEGLGFSVPAALRVFGLFVYFTPII